MIAEGGGNDTVSAGEFPRKGMPEPGLEACGVEENQGWTLSLIEEIRDLRIPDILPADLRMVAVRSLHLCCTLSKVSNASPFT